MYSRIQETMDLQITRSKVEHLLKVGVWLERKKGNNGIEWKHIFMCGSNVMAVGDSEEEFTRLMKTSNVQLFPKIIYSPPNRSREDYFKEVGGNSTVQRDGTNTTDQYEFLASATCVMPFIGDGMPVETYDFSPFELSYVTLNMCREQMFAFLIIVKRSKAYIPRALLMFIYDYLVRTSNRGFRLA